MSLTQATAKGNRPYQEDRSFTLETPEYLAFGVLDGHGGDHCATFCSQALPAAIERQSTMFEFSQVLRDVFSTVNEATKRFDDGCAASVVIIDKVRNQAHIAILGDAPVYGKAG